MLQIFGLMVFLGAFSFIGFGISVANSIEAKESKVVSNIMSALSVSGFISLIIGGIGLIVIS